MLKGGLLAILAGALFLFAGIWVGAVVAGHVRPAIPTSPTGPHPSFDPLQADVEQLVQASGAAVGVTLIELGGPSPGTWSYDGDRSFVAASTYKLPLLMMEAQNVAAGRWRSRDSLCYQDSDEEDGWFDDYQDGTCLTRGELEMRVGLHSDNTAAHILVRYAGGGTALDSYARAHGARQSAFFEPNTTTATDLARLWSDEYAGRAGGRAAQQLLYPQLTHTAFEEGIPAGVPATAAVLHKVGVVDDQVNDAALVRNGPHGDYVLAICTEAGGGEAGWTLLADISHAAWEYESSR